MAPPTASAALRRQRNLQDQHRHVRGKLWYAMRTLRRFTASDLMAVAEHENRGTVMRFLNVLHRTGYLRREWSPEQRCEAHWVLIRDTGPQCPAEVRNRTSLWDFNVQQEYSL